VAVYKKTDENVISLYTVALWTAARAFAAAIGITKQHDHATAAAPILVTIQSATRIQSAFCQLTESQQRPDAEPFGKSRRVCYNVHVIVGIDVGRA
jgi:hypothetical protein